MTTSIISCNPDKFQIHTSEALNVFYPVISIQSEEGDHGMRILLKDYAQLETLITTLKDHCENFLANQPENERA